MRSTSVNMFAFNHAQSAHDAIYFKEVSRPLVQIGAFSYTGDVYVHDFQPSGHPDQEDGIIEIGRFCSLGTGINILIYGHHDHQAITTSPLISLVDYKTIVPPFPKEDVKIGNDVWIGNGATILSGVTIGDGAVIGAMAVVTKDVPPYGIAVGNPARVVKYRFSDEQISVLKKIAWWNWPHEKIAKNGELLLRATCKIIQP